MFYLKHNGENLEISDDNVFTICPDCGKEHNVDLADIMGVEDNDFHGMCVCCEECTAKRVGKRKFIM